MQNIPILIVGLFIVFNSYGQAPNGLSFQAVVRNTEGEIVSNQQIQVKLSILKGSSSGTVVYSELHTPTTNNIGLFTLQIGDGSIVSGDFSSINWGEDIYFLKRELDPDGGTNYLITGISQFLSVPYAFHSKVADTVKNAPDTSSTNELQNLSVSTSGDTLYISDGNYIIVPGISNANPSYPSGTVHCTETATAIVDVYNPATGKTWMDRNLGASRAATSSTDTASYGDLYQWGRGADGHQCRNSDTTGILSISDQPSHGDFIIVKSENYDWRSPQNNSFWQGRIGANNPCPSGYRLPTYAEWEAERITWSSNNGAGAFASPLKLPLAGRHNVGDGKLINVGNSGGYWSSETNGIYSYCLLFFGQGSGGMSNNKRGNGRSVRCIKD